MCQVYEMITLQKLCLLVITFSEKNLITQVEMFTISSRIDQT